MALTKVPSNLDATVATTQSASDNSTNVATTAYVTTAIANLSDSAPEALNTLNEIAAALGDDANYASTTTAAIAAKLPLAGGSLTGALDITAAGTHLKFKRSSFDDFLLGTGTANSQSGLHITNTTDNATMISIHENAPASSFVIDSSGNIGIGTTAPNQLLHLNNSANTTDDAGIRIISGTAGLARIMLGDTGYGSRGRIVYDNDDDSLQLWGADSTTSAERMRIDASGDLFINGTSRANGYPERFLTLSMQPDSAQESCPILELVGNRTANPGNQNGMIQFYNKTSTLTEVGRIASIQGTAVNSGGLTFATYSAGTYGEALRIDQNGNVGIGTNNPTEKLHIGGTAPGDSIIRQDATSSGTNWEIGERVAGKYQFWEDDGDNVRLTIMSTGNVGIGTASPSDKLEVSGTGGTRLKVTNTDTNWAGLDLQAGGNQANYLFFRDESAERSRIMATDGGEISFLTGASPVQRLKISTNDIVMGTGTVNEAAKIISSGGTTVIRAADSNHSIILRGTQDASGNITGNVNTMGFYEYGGYEFYTKQGNSRVKSLDMPSGGKVNINTSTPRSKYFDVNGVAEISESFNINNGTQYDFDYTVPDTTGTGNSYFIIAGYNHYYNTDYGAHKVGVFSCRATSFATMINIGDQSSTGGGAWQFSKPTATTLRIRKTAGTYVGSGHGFIKVFFRDY